MSARKVNIKNLSGLGEFGLIDMLKRKARGSFSGIRGIGDDTAVLPLTKQKCQLFTTDMLVEDVHFTRKMPPEAIGHKAIAASISDIAAMGGTPKFAVVSLGAPASLPVSFAMQMYQGMQRTAGKYYVGIVGGDTVKAKEIIINVAMTGEADKGKVIYRSGAREGDVVFVTGKLGGSFSSGRHLGFSPRVAEAQYLVGKYKPTAMIDVSDGLAGDLKHIAEESGVGAVIEEKLVPKREGAGLKEALYDGEDFELLFTLSLSNAKKLMSRKVQKPRFYCIGKIVSRKHGLFLETADGKITKIDGNSFTHF